MARARLELQQKLEDLLGSRNVYFQPPETFKISYPCIIYSLSQENVWHANDRKYHRMKRYMVTYVDRNPDSELPDILSELRYCSLNRFYTADNLNHWTFDLYY